MQIIMKHRGFAAVLLTAAAAAGPAGAQQILGATFESGNWYGTAHDRDGRFSHCAMNARHGNGTMYFAVSGNWSWRVGWNFEDWSLTPNETMPVMVTIDSMPPQPLMGRARNPTLVMAELPKDAELFNQFRRGNMLTVSVLRRRASFPLAGTDTALTRLTDCVKQQLVAAGSRPVAPDQE